jgi:hypothetical protein
VKAPIGVNVAVVRKGARGNQTEVYFGINWFDSTSGTASHEITLPNGEKVTTQPGVQRYDYTFMYTPSATCLTVSVTAFTSLFSRSEPSSICVSLEQFNTTTTTSSTSTTTTTIPVPSGSYTSQNFYTTPGNLVFGEPMRFYTCSSGQGVTKLQALTTSGYVDKATRFISEDGDLCPDPKYPYMHSYYWVIDEIGQKGSGVTYSLPLRLVGFTSTSAVVKTLYLSEADKLKTFTDTLRCALGEKAYCK